MPKRSYTSTTGEDQSISTEGLDFELDGVTFTCHGQFDANDMTDLASALMDATDNWVDVQALGAVGQLFRTILGEETASAFRRHRREHRTSPEVVSQIMLDLIEDITGRPTVKPSASPAGRPGPAAPSSAAGSPSPATPRRKRRAAATAARSATVQAKTNTAADPQGVLPPEWASGGDVLTVTAPAGPDEGPPVRRIINLGDKNQTRIEPLDETG